MVPTRPSALSPERGVGTIRESSHEVLWRFHLFRGLRTAHGTEKNNINEKQLLKQLPWQRDVHESMELCFGMGATDQH